MEYKAVSKYIRTGPRKLRLVADVVRKMAPEDAVTALAALPKAAAEPLRATIASAIANAKQKNAKTESLKFATIDIGEGPVMKRFRPVARGSTHGYKRRMSHIRVVLTDVEAKE